MTDKMREEFEKWALSNDGPSVSVMRNEVGRYEDEELNMAWLGWQAARTVPDASSEIFASRCPMCSYQHGHQIGCENNPIDIALRAAAPEVKK